MSNMEDLVSNQEQIAAAIEQLYSNFKKDGSDRKSSDYIKRRLETLDSYWSEYQSNHQKLSVFSGRSHPYFTHNHFDHTANRYSTIKAGIMNYQLPGRSRDEFKPSSPIIRPATPTEVVGTPIQGTSVQARGSDSKTDEMLRKQSSNFRAFEHTISSIHLENVTDKWEFEHLLRNIQSRWAAIDSLHWELDSELGQRNPEYESHFLQAEQRYNNMVKYINQKMWSVSHLEKSTPRIDIPNFSGNYQQWSSFKDLFTETIHSNPTLSSAQKMQFLKAKVRGEAERLIQHLPISSDNYSICWDLLNHRYNNKRLIMSSHFDLMLNIPAINHCSAQHIKKLHDVTRESLNAIKNLGVSVESWDPLIIHLLSQKLDSDTLSDYLSSLKDPKEVPNLEEFLSFLERTFTTMESSTRKHESKVGHHKNNNFNPKQSPTGRNISQHINNKNVNFSKYHKCPLCKTNNHFIFNCNHFRQMSSSAKRASVEKLKLCENCLYCHNGKECISEKRCRECNEPHNTLLHEAFAQLDNKPSASTSDNIVSKSKLGQRTASRSSHVSIQNEIPETLLATALIKVQRRDGTYLNLRVLIDQGSQTSLITENAAQQLGLPRQRCQGVITGVGAKETNCKGALSIKCVSMDNNFKFQTDVIIMKSLIKNLPSYTFAKPDWPYLNNITLADPEFYVSRPVDILFGADIYALILTDGICRGVENNLPIAQNTRLGWILCGSTKTLQCNVTLNNLEEIQRFWEIEDIADESNLSSEDQECIQHYKDTTTRREDGRYEVRLPLKSDWDINLGISKNKAVAQFKSLERKFSMNQSMAESYREFMREYQSLGHMTPAPSSSVTKPEYYLTHHGVEKLESSTTKFRVVFNGSAKTSTGYSLNDVMKCGPNLQQDLQSLIIQWRQYKFAFTADIEKMFRQIWINPQDQTLQKIIWRDNERKQLKDWVLSTVSYGTKAAPFLAMMTLRQLAFDERENYRTSSACEVLETSFYMDDLVKGEHQLENAKILRNDLICLLKSGGFNLRKWRSNITELSDSNQDNFNFQQSDTPSSKTLGLSWDHRQDMFTFCSKIELHTERETKRTLLSNISKLFDPLGWLTPLSTKLKIIFQKVWLSAITWDEPLPEDIMSEWSVIKHDLININKLQIPRWLSTGASDILELHAFCDASTKAYACVVYCKVKRNNQNSITLLVGKSRLVPKSKTISLPRLELSAAYLLSKLVLKVQQCLSTYEIKIFGWSDSMIVLGWLNGDPARWKTFVSNRVREITKCIPSACWRYVKSEENPADCASRGMTASQLINHDLWWKGPSWLPDFDGQGKQPEFITHLELRKVRQVNTVAESNSDNNVIYQLLRKYSSISKLIRIIAWMLRLARKQTNKQSYLSLSELNRSEQIIIKNVQQIDFSEEIKSISAYGTVSPKSKLSSLTPYLDQNGILRVQGRLRNSNLPHDMKHPIIISGYSRLAQLLIDQAHKACFHGGARLTSAFLRQRYWLIGGNKIVKKQLRNCVKCRRHDPIKHEQIMGDLPSARITPTRPFMHTGVDYTGFVDVKCSKGRGIKTSKGYIVVFVCMVTKAVHLELVSDLSSSAFLAALRRMVSRRGAPCHIYSDNGTNFVGANRILNKEFLNLEATLDDTFHTSITDMQIQWHFNAPGWPSAGGLWEAAVKSLKYHLKRVIGEQKLTFEEYSTLLAQIEACLNSRPLCPLNEDPDDLDYLTPAHFLASGPTNTIIETERDLRTRWQLTQKIFDDVWKRWHVEYLSQLASRSKWRQPKENLKVGDIVIIHDANLPPGKWALGRIISLHPGKDDFVRVVSLKTKNGTLKRPISKISKLPVQTSELDNPDSTPQPKQKEKNSAYTTIKRSTIPHLFNIVNILFILLFMIMTPVQGSYQISNFNTSQGFYFDRISNVRLQRDHWKLVIYYDMSPYWQSFELLSKYINHLDTICNYETKNTISQCDVILLQLHHGLNELEHYNNMLLGKQFTRYNNIEHARRARGLINGVGFLANKLFGVLDQEFAEQYERDIESIRANQKHLALLWKNQTSIVEGELNLIKRVETSVNKHSKLFNQHIISLEKSLNRQNTNIQAISNTSDFTLSALIAQGILVNLQSIQDTIIDSLTDIYSGRFNFHLLTPEQLRDEMNIISSSLSRDLALPLTNQQSISKMYHLLNVKARATSKNILFEIWIPLVSRDNFELYHLIPIPQQTETAMTSLIPISDYVAINIHQDSYVTLSEEDVHSCVEIEADYQLCPLKEPIHQMRSDENLCIKNSISKQCQTRKSACVDYWKELYTINTYLYFCCGHCSVRIICENQITAERLRRSGIITISDACIIKGDSFTIYAHRALSNTLQRTADTVKVQIPPINNIFNVSIPTTAVEDHPLYSDHQKDFEAIYKQIQEMKTSASEGTLTERMSYHDVHHYVIIYVVLGAGVVALAVLLWRRHRPRATSAGCPEAPTTQPHTETQPASSRRDEQPAPAQPRAVPRAVGQSSSISHATSPEVGLPSVYFDRFSAKCVSESAVNQCCARSELNEKPRSVVDKGSSPVIFHSACVPVFDSAA